MFTFSTRNCLKATIVKHRYIFLLLLFQELILHHKVKTLSHCLPCYENRATVDSLSLQHQLGLKEDMERKSFVGLSKGEVITFDDIQKLERSNHLVEPFPKSIYGVIYFSLIWFVNDETLSVWNGFLLGCMLLPLLIVTSGVQAILLYYLWFSIPPLQDSSFCEKDQNNFLLLMAAEAVFLISLMPSLHELFLEGQIFTECKLTLLQDGRKDSYTVTSVSFRSFWIFLVYSFEVTVWISVLIIGSGYILTTEGVSNLVQATVAITFINEIDNMAIFLAGRYYWTILSRFYFILPNYYKMDDRKYVQYWSALAFPLMIIAVLCAIYLLRNYSCVIVSVVIGE
jgi:hypothetical protein